MASYDFINRFWSKVVQSSDLDGCWEWTGSVGTNGYGHLKVRSHRMQVAHRVAWELSHAEEAPQGKDICHTCDNRTCVRPDHLWVGSRADNMADARAKERTRGAPMKAQCLRGHDLSGENLIFVIHKGRQERRCRECVRILGRENDRKRYERRKARRLADPLLAERQREYQRKADAKRYAERQARGDFRIAKAKARGQVPPHGAVP